MDVPDDAEASKEEFTGFIDFEENENEEEEDLYVTKEIINNLAKNITNVAKLLKPKKLPPLRKLTIDDLRSISPAVSDRSNAESVSSKGGPDPPDPKYLVPFEKGWKRELITSNVKNHLNYIDPSGKKYRSLNEVSKHLPDGLTTENFCYTRKLLGVGSDYETLRDIRTTPVTPSNDKSNLKSSKENGTEGKENIPNDVLEELSKNKTTDQEQAEMANKEKIRSNSSTPEEELADTLVKKGNQRSTSNTPYQELNEVPRKREMRSTSSTPKDELAPVKKSQRKSASNTPNQELNEAESTKKKGRNSSLKEELEETSNNEGKQKSTSVTPNKELDAVQVRKGKRRSTSVTPSQELDEVQNKRGNRKSTSITPNQELDEVQIKKGKRRSSSITPNQELDEILIEKGKLRSASNTPKEQEKGGDKTVKLKSTNKEPDEVQSKKRKLESKSSTPNNEPEEIMVKRKRVSTNKVSEDVPSKSTTKSHVNKNETKKENELQKKKTQRKSNGVVGVKKLKPKVQAEPSAPLGPRMKVTELRKSSSVQGSSDVQMGRLPPTWRTAEDNTEENKWGYLHGQNEPQEEGRLEPCTIRCQKAMGLIPTVQCTTCLCLYHAECCQFSAFKTMDNYLCKNCQTNVIEEEKKKNRVRNIIPMMTSVEKTPPLVTPKPINPIFSSPTSFQAVSPLALRLATQMSPMPMSNSNITWFSPSTMIRSSIPAAEPPTPPLLPPPSPQAPPLPEQYTLTINNRKYIYVPKTISQPNTDSSSRPESSFVATTPKHNLLLDSHITDTSVYPQPAIPSQYFLVNSGGNNTNQPTLPRGSATQQHFAKLGRQPPSNFNWSNFCSGYEGIRIIFQYLNVRDLLAASRVCKLWRNTANEKKLWTCVRMRNSQVKNWTDCVNHLVRYETKHLDLRKMLLPDDDVRMWNEFRTEIVRANTLEKLDLCRCSGQAVEWVVAACRHVLSFSATSIGIKESKSPQDLDLNHLSKMTNLQELRLKSFTGLNLNGSLKGLEVLAPTLRHLTITTCKQLADRDIRPISKLINLQVLELGECSELGLIFSEEVVPKLTKLRRLRLEKISGACPITEYLKSLSNLSSLKQLELINTDITHGFESALPCCTNIEDLLIIPTYVNQSATTNQIILKSVFKLNKTLKSFVWVVTVELLKVTELFVARCKKMHTIDFNSKTNSNSVPILKPVPLPEGYCLPDPLSGDINHSIATLELSELNNLLNKALPSTVVKVHRAHFQSTWRQTIGCIV